jgi:hypothetical protein
MNRELYTILCAVTCFQPSWALSLSGAAAQQDRLCSIPAALREAKRGQTLDSNVEREILTASGAAIVRVLKPGDPASMDFNDSRVNIQVDDAGRILSVRCG